VGCRKSWEIKLTFGKKKLKRAVLWHEDKGSKVKCDLCNFRCVIGPGKRGHCGVRVNEGGVLYSLVYDKVCSAGVDPIEKKPLFHFMPGSKAFSIATPGCNFQCEFCQNWQISQMAIDQNEIQGQAYSPKDIVYAAIESGCKSIAYTYTEPTIFMELCEDTARIAKKNGLQNIFVSNGYMTREAIDFASEWLDAINIDLKSFRDDYYKRICKASLGPVLDTIKYIAKETDIWMELTTLVVPGENDSEEELKDIAEFIASEVGVDTPWHISKFYPMYHMDNKPGTPCETLVKAREIAKEAGLRYVYIGNEPKINGQDTCCYNCGHVLIERKAYSITNYDVDKGCCSECKATIEGRGL
jgi:pyruvate formate lyase activating enzyme